MKPGHLMTRGVDLLGIVDAVARAATHPHRAVHAAVHTAEATFDQVGGWLVREVGSRVDLTPLVRQVVDLDVLVAGVDIDAIAERLDVQAVIDRVDLVAIVETVLAEMDLPEIIRVSTGSVASGTVRGMRMQSMSGDEAVTRALHRLRERRPADQARQAVEAT